LGKCHACLQGLLWNVEHRIEPPAGDHDHPLDALGEAGGEVGPRLRSLRIATELESREAEGLGELLDKVRPAQEAAHRPVLLARISLAETGAIRRVDPETSSAKRRQHESPARPAG
jgi:hypothetical protein